MSEPDASADAALIKLLERWSITDKAHIGASLLTHLLGVHRLLEQWGARPALRHAGLFHAVNGTQHFQGSLDRDVADLDPVIGAEAAAIVATYARCCRDTVWPQIGRVEPVLFRDAKTGASDPMTAAALHDFCELTMANELDILQRNRGHRDAFGGLFREVFGRMQPFVSSSAWRAFLQILGRRESLPERCGRGYRRVLRALRRRLGFSNWRAITPDHWQK